MSGLVKIVGAGIGLASEAIHHSRAKSKAAKEALEVQGRQSGNSTPVQNGTQSPCARQSASQSDSQSVHQSAIWQDGLPTTSLRVNNESDNTNMAGPSNAPPPIYLTPEEEKEQLAERGKQALAAGTDNFDYYGDEAVWELDEMAEYVDPPSYEQAAGETAREGAVSPIASPTEERPEDDAELAELQGTAKDEAKKQIRIVRQLVRLAGPAPSPTRRIPCPVIVPQRRPRTKARGFVRAYAPVLSDCGISQDVFLQFLKGWYLASKASPWIDVVFVAAGIVGFVPEAGAQIASIVVQVAAGTAREIQSRHRNNSFLDRANQELFMPRGLFAMVLAFKDDMPDAQGRGGLLGGLTGVLGKSLVSTQRLDINQTTIKYSQLAALGGSTSSSNPNKTKDVLRNLRTNNGKTYTELELPQAAELVYPDLDNAAERDLATVGDYDAPKSANKWKSAGKFVSSYLDRRAQAEYEGTHQGSSTAVPADARKPFMSRYADPNSAANSGSLVALLTGGYIAPDTRRRGGRGGLSMYDRNLDFDDRHRRRRQGPIGAGIGLISTGVNMYMQSREQRQAKTSECTSQTVDPNEMAGGPSSNSRAQSQMHHASNDHQVPYNNPPAPYGSSNPPAPYGSSNPPAPYGGSSDYPVDRPLYQTDQPYGSDNNYNTSNVNCNRTSCRDQPRGIKKILQQDVLYLLIVNLPTDEEVQASVAQLERLTSRAR
ncbi:hypothetical protein SEPCBS57363_004197 [Sporothrix epigloea]|uniref:Uncharacterized protein n=1 Tax=Sporothrix epigloea TaxID=1892477 RepID=A0ABP0DUJ7_9PEZI